MFPHRSLLRRPLGFLAGVLILITTACGYRLPLFVPPTQERIRIVAKAPEQYVLRVDMGTVSNYDVPHDGRLAVNIPSYRPTCGVYLFGVVKVGGDKDPLKVWSVSVSRNGKILRRLSLRKVAELPMDQAGYQVVKIGH